MEESGSRQDDLLSIFFIMIYLLNQGEVPGLKKAESSFNREAYLDMMRKDFQQNQKLDHWCKGPAKCLIELSQHLLKLDKNGLPDYDKLIMITRNLYQNQPYNADLHSNTTTTEIQYFIQSFDKKQKH